MIFVSFAGFFLLFVMIQFVQWQFTYEVTLTYDSSMKLKRNDAENLEILLFWASRHSENYTGHTYSVMSSKCRLDCNPSPNMDLELHLDTEKKCNTFPLFLMDSPIKQNGVHLTAAKESIPCVFMIKQSPMLGAGFGIFTKIPISEGTLFGPYKGDVYVKRDTHSDSELEFKANVHSVYTWEIDNVAEDGRISETLVVDALDETKSNWLRWINAARFEEEQNLVPYVLDGTDMYYFVCRNIGAGRELLVWYGPAMGFKLGIKSPANSARPMERYFAPPKELSRCTQSD